MENKTKIWKVKFEKFEDKFHITLIKKDDTLIGKLTKISESSPKWKYKNIFRAKYSLENNKIIISPFQKEESKFSLDLDGVMYSYNQNSIQEISFNSDKKLVLNPQLYVFTTDEQINNIISLYIDKLNKLAEEMVADHKVKYLQLIGRVNQFMRNYPAFLNDELINIKEYLGNINDIDETEAMKIVFDRMETKNIYFYTPNENKVRDEETDDGKTKSLTISVQKKKQKIRLINRLYLIKQTLIIEPSFYEKHTAEIKQLDKTIVYLENKNEDVKKEDMNLILDIFTSLSSLILPTSPISFILNMVNNSKKIVNKLFKIFNKEQERKRRYKIELDKRETIKRQSKVERKAPRIKRRRSNFYLYCVNFRPRVWLLEGKNIQRRFRNKQKAEDYARSFVKGQAPSRLIIYRMNRSIMDTVMY